MSAGKFITIIRHGVTRIVILVGPWAIKIPNFFRWEMFLHGLLCNRNEAIWASTGWPEFCPIVFSVPGGFLNVMKRVQPFRGTVPDGWFQRFVDKPKYRVPMEQKDNSFGFLDGRLVAIDYGD